MVPANELYAEVPHVTREGNATCRSSRSMGVSHRHLDIDVPQSPVTQGGR